jgi:mycothiol synthase
MRPYQSEDDYWRMRQFLREVFILNGRTERSWHVARLDYARWHGCMNVSNVRMQDVAFLWEDEGEIVAMMMPDGGPREVHFSITPNAMTVELEEEMLSVAEEHLALVRSDGTRSLRVWSPHDDAARQEMLREHGYSRSGYAEHQWRRDLDVPISAVPVPNGYTIRALGDGLELLERCYASGLGFHEGDIHVAVENRDDPTWYHNIQNAPLYRRDLDLVAVAADGAIAAFCTIWFDDVTRSAYFEPVATVPAHQQRGLGTSLLREGLCRLQRMGATRAFVGGNSSAANALYSSVFGPEQELHEAWVKEWTL